MEVHNHNTGDVIKTIPKKKKNARMKTGFLKKLYK